MSEDVHKESSVLPLHLGVAIAVRCGCRSVQLAVEHLRLAGKEDTLIAAIQHALQVADGINQFGKVTAVDVAKATEAAKIAANYFTRTAKAYSAAKSANRFARRAAQAAAQAAVHAAQAAVSCVEAAKVSLMVCSPSREAEARAKVREAIAANFRSVIYLGSPNESRANICKLATKFTTTASACSPEGLKSVTDPDIAAYAAAYAADIRQAVMLAERRASSVDSGPAGPFGPYWHDAETEKGEESECEGDELVLEFAVPENATAEEIEQGLKQYLGELDNVHRAHGKGGITVETLEVESFNTSEVLS